MKNLLFILALLISTIGISQETNTEDYIIDDQTIQENIVDENSIGEDIPAKKQNLKKELKAEEKERKESNKMMKKMAEQRAVELQKALNLTNHTSYKLLQSIIKYSKKANKVLQSNISEDEKTKSLSNIVYFQNEEFKKYLTVHEFYKYLEISGL